MRFISLFTLACLSNISSVHADCLNTCDDLRSTANCLDTRTYGRYYGPDNFCDAADQVFPGEENSVCLAGSDSCPPGACDPVDDVCRVQRDCLAQLDSGTDTVG